MFGAIARRLVTGGALLLAAFADQIAQMAAEVALELQQSLSAGFAL